MGLKAFVRCREARSLAFIIIIFTTLIVPFHTIVGHYGFVERMASRYLPDVSYVLVRYPGMNFLLNPPYGDGEVPIYLMEASVSGGGRSLQVTIYSFGNLDGVRELFNIDLAGLGVDGCLLSREVAVDLGVNRGDKIEVAFGDRVETYVVRGFSSIFPMVVPEPVEPFYTVVVYRAVEGGEASGPNIFEYGGYKPLLRGLRSEAVNILNIWGSPILVLAAIGIYIALLRAVVSSRHIVGNMRDIGFSRRAIYSYFAASTSILIVASTFVGISAGLVASQVVARILYLLYGLDITPVLGLDQLVILSSGLILLGHIMILFSLPALGMVYSEGD